MTYNLNMTLFRLRFNADESKPDCQNVFRIGLEDNKTGYAEYLPEKDEWVVYILDGVQPDSGKLPMTIKTPLYWWYEVTGVLALLAISHYAQYRGREYPEEWLSSGIVEFLL